MDDKVMQWTESMQYSVYIVWIGVQVGEKEVSVCDKCPYDMIY